MEYNNITPRDMAVVPVVPEYLEQLMSVGLNGFRACHGFKDIRIHTIIKDLNDGRFMFMISSPSVYEYISMCRLLEQNPDFDESKTLVMKDIYLVGGKDVIVLQLPLINLEFEELEEGERLPDSACAEPTNAVPGSDTNGDEKRHTDGTDCDGDCGNCGGMRQSYDDDEEDSEEDEGTDYGSPDDFFLDEPDDWKLV